MIDHDAAAELWDRYKRGERNGLFSRRLYTAQGQKAFEEIRRKYRGDAEFRQTVEHYIHEFERLIDDVSRGERGAAVARNYLTSGHRQGLHHAGARRGTVRAIGASGRGAGAPPSAFCRNGRRTAHSPSVERGLRARSSSARNRSDSGARGLAPAVIAALPFPE